MKTTYFFLASILTAIALSKPLDISFAHLLGSPNPVKDLESTSTDSVFAQSLKHSRQVSGIPLEFSGMTEVFSECIVSSEPAAQPDTECLVVQSEVGVCEGDSGRLEEVYVDIESLEICRILAAEHK
ncbi:hypothetical protein DPSP01_014075 [Paraphaeosphaeria sporulosa]